MTNYELIQELINFPSDAEIVFSAGPFAGYNCDFKFYDYTETGLKPELKIIIKD